MGCEKDRVISASDSLAFSIDTLFFDTVFTEVGTATRNFKVYNRSNQTLRIESIRFERSNSPFRFNIDGETGTSVENLELLPGDSAFVFVEATINPNGGNLPLVVEENLVFQFGNGQRNMPIVAWGQDANYIRADTRVTGLPPYKILPPNAVWTANKPYVIYGYAVVDSANSLQIEAGTKVYFHSGSGLWVFRYGQIAVRGTKEQPVVFQGDRLEPQYQDIPGQWDRIWINEGPAGRDNLIEHAVVKNALVGIQLETLPFSYNLNAPTSENKTTIRNTRIQNCSALALFLRNYRVDASNCVVVNGGQYAIGISGGGEYQFNHITAGNYASVVGRKTPAFFMTNAYEAEPGVVQVRSITNSRFTNCIFSGIERNEFDFDLNNLAPNQVVFDHCLIKSEKTFSSTLVVESYFNQNPGFTDVGAFNFKPTANAFIRGKGKGGIETADIDLNPRNIDTPDLGAFEYKPD